MAQSVELDHMTLDLGSNPDLRVVRWSPLPGSTFGMELA